jgi:hypothetical protein
VNKYPAIYQICINVRRARAACAVDQFLFFSARSPPTGTVEIISHVLLLPRSSCAVLDFNSSAAQSLRGSRPCAG